MSASPLSLLRFLATAGALALASMSCTDPVPDEAVARLGGEKDGVSPGELHRPGQPCLVCHSERGPASNKPFAVGGTVFEKGAADSPPAVGMEVHLRDAQNNPRSTVTNEVGNFYLTEKEWSDITFPLKVGLRRDGKTRTMATTVNREGSCNFCHKPATNSRLAVPGDEPRTSIGQIDFEGAQ
jgi:hypothetical protein